MSVTFREIKKTEYSQMQDFLYNAASCRVLEKAGFQFEGLLRQNAVKNEKIIDMKLYAILKHQWAEEAK